MAIRKVLRMGNPLLSKKALEVEQFNTQALHALTIDLRDTMAAETGAGLAAPQIGHPIRLVVFGFECNSRYPKAPPIPWTVLINPIIEPLSKEKEEAWEGCLSVPGLRGLVPRYVRIRYFGQDIYGYAIDRQVEGFHARLVQHECDHLDGILYPQRMQNLSSLGFTIELQAAGVFNSLPSEDS